MAKAWKQVEFRKPTLIGHKYEYRAALTMEFNAGVQYQWPGQVIADVCNRHAMTVAEFARITAFCGRKFGVCNERNLQQRAWQYIRGVRYFSKTTEQWEIIGVSPKLDILTAMGLAINLIDHVDDGVVRLMGYSIYPRAERKAS